MDAIWIRMRPRQVRTAVTTVSGDCECEMSFVSKLRMRCGLGLLGAQKGRVHARAIPVPVLALSTGT
jgi:hypothetical protein